MSEGLELVKLIPQWLLLAGLLYLIVLLTVGVVRGQEVQFFPPKIGPRTTGPEKNEKEQNDAAPKQDVGQELTSIDASLKAITRTYQDDMGRLRQRAYQARHDAARAADEGNDEGRRIYLEEVDKCEAQIRRIEDNLLKRLGELETILRTKL
jgi:hypothetical protein